MRATDTLADTDTFAVGAADTDRQTDRNVYSSIAIMKALIKLEQSVQYKHTYSRYSKYAYKEQTIYT